MTALVGPLTRVRLTVWRRTPNQLRGVGVTLGVLLAGGTVLVAGVDVLGAGSSPELLAIVFAVWTVGWAFGPIQVGGNDLLRPEWFGMLPVPPRRLAAGMLGAALVGIGPAITLLAFLALVVHGVRLGVGPAVVAVPAAVAQLLLVVLLSKVVGEVMGNAARSRVATELAALQYGLVLTLSFVGWAVVWAPIRLARRTDLSFAELLPAAASVVIRVLPSGWGLVAVEAADRGSWPAAVGMLAALGLLVAATLLYWAALLRRRLTGAVRGSGTRPRPRYGRRLLPATPLGAVVGRDLRTWWRDPRRGVELRTALWAAVLSTLALWLADLPAALPFAGVMVAILCGVTCVNIYAMDGTALWLTLLTPGATRVDVRGRQAAWLIIFAPAAAVLTLAGLVIGDVWWALPAVLALVPALLGGAAGLIPLLSVVALAPETDAHRRSGNPGETGADAAGLYFLTMFSIIATALPAGALLWLAVARSSTAIGWLAVAVGILTGVTYTWWFGRIAHRRLAARGPELLTLMRVGPPVPTAVPRAKDPTDRRTRILVNGAGLAMIPVFPLGLVPIVFTTIGKPYWLYSLLPALHPVRWPFQLLMLAAGLTWLTLAYRAHRAGRSAAA